MDSYMEEQFRVYPECLRKGKRGLCDRPVIAVSREGAGRARNNGAITPVPTNGAKSHQQGRNGQTGQRGIRHPTPDAPRGVA